MIRILLIASEESGTGRRALDGSHRDGADHESASCDVPPSDPDRTGSSALLHEAPAKLPLDAAGCFPFPPPRAFPTVSLSCERGHPYAWLPLGRRYLSCLAVVTSRSPRRRPCWQSPPVGSRTNSGAPLETRDQHSGVHACLKRHPGKRNHLSCVNPARGDQCSGAALPFRDLGADAWDASDE